MLLAFILYQLDSNSASTSGGISSCSSAFFARVYNDAILGSDLDNPSLMRSAATRSADIARIFQNGQICIESGERGLTGVSRETPKFDGFGDF